MNLLIISLSLHFPVVSPAPQHYSSRQLGLLNPACNNCGWSVDTILFFFLIGYVSPSISSRKVSSAQTQFVLAKLYVVATKFNTAKANRRYINSGYAGSTYALYKVSHEYSSADSSPIHKSISKSNVNAYFCCNPYIISLNTTYR